MIITRSPALKTFKQEVGQANHMLITILVGLDGIISSDIKINKEFHAAWSPKDRIASANRSKDFAKKSCLGWMVDCLDMYVRLVNKTPSLIQDTDLKHSIDSEENSRSIYKKLALICEKYEIHGVYTALADVLICWRNRLTHYDAENDITPTNRKILIDNKEAIKTEYRGLDIEPMLLAFDNKQPPTFKEVASLVSASTKLVYAIDDALIQAANAVRYADQVIMKYLKQDASKRLNEVFSNENEKIHKSLRQILVQHGFVASEKDENGVDAYCLQLSKLHFNDVKTRFSNGTFVEPA